LRALKLGDHDGELATGDGELHGYKTPLADNERIERKYRTPKARTTSNTIPPITPPTAPPTAADESSLLCDTSSGSTGMKQPSPQPDDEETSVPVDCSGIDDS